MSLIRMVLKMAMIYSWFYCIDIIAGGFGTRAVGGGVGGVEGGGGGGPEAKNEFIYFPFVPVPFSTSLMILTSTESLEGTYAPTPLDAVSFAVMVVTPSSVT